MKVVTEPASFRPPPNGTAVSIGAYDGVHRGHQAVLRELRRLAAAGHHQTAVVTFDRHPASVVRPQSAPRLLTDLDQKLEVMAGTGDVDYALVVRFDKARANEEAEDFVTEVLVESLAARLVVVGEDFHFGRGRRGSVDLLREMGARLGFQVVGLALIGDGQVISSTYIRSLIDEGDVSAAARLLGRPYEVRGIVRPGDGRGGELGFPTANVTVAPEILIPGIGIYAGWYERADGSVHGAAISVGRRPTFPGGEHQAPVLEAHVLDFEGDLYNEEARIRFVERIRDEERFDSVELLVAQIVDDVATSRARLKR